MILSNLKRKDGVMAHKKYLRFNLSEREILFKGLIQGRRQIEISRELNRSPSTISREIRRGRNGNNPYQITDAEEFKNVEALKRRKPCKLRTSLGLQKYVENHLEKRWSPDQISVILKEDFPQNLEMRISPESIYKYIYSLEDKDHKNKLISYLRQSRRRRRPKKKIGPKRNNIKNLVSIHKRPLEALDREVIGHWEGDLVVGQGHKSAIGTLVERVSRYTIIIPFKTFPNAINTTLAFAAALGILPSHMKKSLTYDRGTEMSAHQKFTEITEIPVFFADAYSPWQRGTNENTNGLIRDYYPKGTDFREITEECWREVQEALNSRPRKILSYKTPLDIFLLHYHQLLHLDYSKNLLIA